MQDTCDRLTARWHEELTRVTELSLRLHSLDDSDPMSSLRAEAYEAELSVARQSLAQIEAELARVPHARVVAW
jgi:hypothetical protein